MKYLLFFGFFLLFQQLQAQQVKLTNAVVISQFDKEEDRYANASPHGRLTQKLPDQGTSRYECLEAGRRPPALAPRFYPKNVGSERF